MHYYRNIKQLFTDYDADRVRVYRSPSRIDLTRLFTFNERALTADTTGHSKHAHTTLQTQPNVNETKRIT